MIRTTLAAVALVSGCSIGLGETSTAASKKEFLAYESCVVGHARSFAGSPDPTDNIVKNALASCASQRRALSEALVRAGVSSDGLAASLSAFDKQVFQASSRAIVEERAAH